MTSSAMQLSVEVWSHICIELDAAPRKVFMLMSTIKHLHAFISGNEQWWKGYWARHQKYLSRGEWRRHWYLRTDAIGILRPLLFEHVLRLVYSTNCSMCGCRYRHSINHHVKLRICKSCKQDSFVSNAVLFYEYGIPCKDVIDNWEPFVKFLPMHEYKPSEVYTMSRNPIDTNPTVTRDMLFFWKPDIAGLYNLPALRIEQASRVRKVNTLKAAIKRRFAQAQKPRYRAETLYNNEIVRVKKPLLPPKWCVGGPQSLAWRCHSSHENPTMAMVAQRRTFKAKLMMYHPVPILAPGEYVLKTAVQKLKLNAETVLLEHWDIPDRVRFPYSRKVYQVPKKTGPNIYT